MSDANATPQEQDAAPRKSGWARRVFACVIGAVVALGAVELAVRVLGLAPPPVTKRVLIREDAGADYHCYPSNPNGTFDPVPDISQGQWKLYKMLRQFEELPLSALPETPWCVEYTFETLGIRGPTPAPMPAPGVVRIAAVGDSFVLGEGVRYRETLDEQIEALAAGTEIVNFGQSGANLSMEMPAHQASIEHFGCRRALLVLLVNDVDQTDAIEATEQGAYDMINLREEQLGDLGARPWWAQLSRVGHLIDQHSRMRQVTDLTIRNYLDRHDPTKNAKNLAEMQSQLAAIAADPRCKTVVAIYPLMFQLGDYPLAPAHAKLVEMAQKAGLPVLDLLPAFAGQSERELQVHPADHHPNARAHGIAARAIVEWLKRDVPGFLPQ